MYFKNKITELQTLTINLFTKIICLEKPIIELKTKIKYILDYSYYLLSIHQNDKEKKNEIARITRILLSKLSGCPSDYINLIAQNCFEFMIFYKNSEKLFNIDYNTNKEEIRDTIYLINDSSKSEIKDNEQKLNDNIINDEKLNEINNDNDNDNNKINIIINDDNKKNSINSSNILEENDESLITKTDKNDSCILKIKLQNFKL